MSQANEDGLKFEGEEAGSGFASPTLDLIASVFLIALSLLVMAASVALPVPGEIRTAPGLLPFIVSASLLVMALGLGASAWVRRSEHAAGVFAERDLSADFRSLLLAGAIAVYIAAMQFLAFQENFSLLGLNLRLSAFEPATIITLALIIHLSWRGPIWVTTTISFAWTILLSVVFQIVFRIPLPGTF
ncbi:MAG: tripartite tricarboxylate transporter TctB family protein [Pseudomonadota bacterium]